MALSFPKGDAAEEPCPNCTKRFKEHFPPDLKCPFEASTFEPTENVRIALANDINRRKLEDVALTKQYGEVWDHIEIQEVYHIHGFLAPFVSATRKSDGVFGSLTFQHLPRYYFHFVPE